MASNGEGEAEAAQGALEVKVGARDLKRLRGLRVKNHFCSMITVSRRGDREGFRQLVPLGDAPHAIDRAQDWFRVELDRMLLFEDGHPAVFVVQGAQSSPMWLHVDAFIEEARADFGEDTCGFASELFDYHCKCFGVDAILAKADEDGQGLAIEACVEQV
ncbi:Hypothetical Protein FCC1311_111632 [Hondaea fermentalgiana]|uniref:Uncharacterized protein n=1 Tax=Hondaea fermentalgiana TaxID=2315210 RepID=A0A2R5GVS0_9STRA|nr:Hypothetical Protein FCC1311_111632 [Hondaea fermentalgiana]|eukprot:GBG34940.1 Hypothetical Protein FCC1311_111632 [Hondaea fermentalgiana]